MDSGECAWASAGLSCLWSIVESVLVPFSCGFGTSIVWLGRRLVQAFEWLLTMMH